MNLPDEALRNAEAIYEQGRRDGGMEMVKAVLSDVFASLSELPDTKRQKSQRLAAQAALVVAAGRLGISAHEARQMAESCKA